MTKTIAERLAEARIEGAKREFERILKILTRPNVQIEKALAPECWEGLSQSEIRELIRSHKARK